MFHAWEALLLRGPRYLYLLDLRLRGLSVLSEITFWNERVLERLRSATEGMRSELRKNQKPGISPRELPQDIPQEDPPGYPPGVSPSVIPPGILLPGGPPGENLYFHNLLFGN